MFEWLTEPFQADIAQRALIEVGLLALACGPLGCWVLLYRRSYSAESLAHGMLPGLVGAALIGIPLALGAFGGVVIASLAITLTARSDRVAPDSATAVAVTTLFGAGALLALAPDVPARIQELLFGNLLGVSEGDLALTTVLVAVTVILLAVTHRHFATAGFDSHTAQTLGTRPGQVDLLLLLLLGVVLAVAAQVLGNLLVVALIIAPAAAASQLARRLPTMFAIAIAVALLGGIGGLYLSYYLDAAAGASITLVLVVVFFVCLRGHGRTQSSPAQ